MTSRTQRAIGVGALLIGVALLTAGLLLGFGTVGRYGAPCGSGFGGVSRNAALTSLTRAVERDNGVDLSEGDPEQEACASAVRDRRRVAWSLVGPGVVGVVIGAGALLRLAGQRWDAKKAPTATL